MSRLPICDLCNKPVDALQQTYDPARAVYVYQVRCHGATETATLTPLDVIACLNIEMGRAFFTTRIE